MLQLGTVAEHLIHARRFGCVQTADIKLRADGKDAEHPVAVSHCLHPGPDSDRGDRLASLEHISGKPDPEKAAFVKIFRRYRDLRPGSDKARERQHTRLLIDLIPEIHQQIHVVGRSLCGRFHTGVRCSRCSVSGCRSLFYRTYRGKRGGGGAVRSRRLHGGFCIPVPEPLCRFARGRLRREDVVLRVTI